MENSDLKDYVQSIQNRVSIAVAFAVIRSKPSHLTLKEYAEYVQEKCFNEWIRSNETTVFDDKILEFQREIIFNQLSDLAAVPSTGVEMCISDGSEIDIPDITTDLVWKGADWSDSSEDESSGGSEVGSGSDPVRSNLSFVEDMVQLKFAVEASQSVATDEVCALISKHNEPGKVSELRKLTYSEDSGFGDNTTLAICRPRSISSNTLRLVSHSMRTEGLVNKCLRSVVDRLKEGLVRSPRETFLTWDGSVMAQLTQVLTSLPDNPHVYHQLSLLVVATLELAWSTSDQVQYDIFEYQLALVTSLCKSRYVLEAGIKWTLKRLEEVIKKVSQDNVYRDEGLSELAIIEKSPLLMEFLEALVSKWPIPKGGDSRKACGGGVVTVNELWKKHTAPPTSGKMAEREDTTPRADQLLVSCAEACERVVTASSHLFPLLSVHAFALLQHIQSLIPPQNDSNCTSLL